jgi:hypothetical protein
MKKKSQAKGRLPDACFFGKFTSHDVEGNCLLEELHNPIDHYHDLWGVRINSAHGECVNYEIVPCDGFISDLSSAPRFLWMIYPPMFGKKAAFIHDWGYRAHKQQVAELYEELRIWFDFKRWTEEQRMVYIAWLQGLSKGFWDALYFVLTKSKDLPFWKRWLALKTLMVFGWYAWMKGATNRTKRHRERRK